MSKKITLSLLLVLAFLSGRAAYTPVGVTGFNADVIANGSGTATSSISSSVSGGFDGVGYTFVAQDYSSGTYTPTYYLPTGGLLTSSLTTGLTFQLADYSSNNVLRLVDTTDAGTLVFTTPSTAGRVYLLGTSGSGSANFSATVYFADGTTQLVASMSFPDWYSSGGSIVGIGRVSTVDNHTEGTSVAPSFFQEPINIDPANYAKNIDSIQITKTGGDGIIGVFAVSSEDPCSGTPTLGTITASLDSACAPYSSTLTLSGASSGAGITYQWQSSADGSAWINVDGATGTTYNAAITGDIYYHVIEKCLGSDDSVITDSIYLYANVPTITYASIPYTQSFESWVPACHSFDRPGTEWSNQPSTGNNSWRRNDEGSDASWNSAGSGMYSPASTAGTYSARFHSYYAPDNSVGNMDLHIDLSAAGSKDIYFDYINTDGSDMLRVQISEDSGATFTTLDSFGINGSWSTQNITTTSTSAHAIIRFSAKSDYGNSDIGIDNLGVNILSTCSGTPSASAVTATEYSSCSSFNTTLSIPVDPSVSGLTYQWQSSTDSLAWADVDGETNATYSPTVFSNIYYRLKVTCTASSTTDSSAGILFQIIVPTATTATMPFFESFESWIGTCYTYDRPGINWLTNPATGNNSWRRDDEGSDASWGSLTSYMYSPASTDSAHSARFHSGFTHAGIKGNMDLYIDLSPAGTKSINFDYINLNGTDSFNVELSEDSGATFTSLAHFTTTSGWVNENVTTTSVAANAIIRFIATADYGSTDIGIDNLHIGVIAVCSGTPAPGAINATVTNSCTEYNPVLSVATDPTISGITYQWQSSTDSIAWANVDTATGPVFVPDVTTSIYYRLLATCTASGDVDTTAGVLLQYIVPVATNATVPFFESFEGWMGSCFNYDRPGVNWLTNPATGNNSWRRDDQGADASWALVTSYMYSPASTDSSHSARFHSGYTHAGIQGNMDLHIDLSAAGSKLIRFDYINLSGTDYMDVQLSTDSGATFTSLGHYTTTSAWVPEVLTTTSTSANAIIRFLATADYGSTDIGIDSLSVTILPSCSGAPVAGTFSASATTGCTIYSPMLAIDTPLYNTGITYQWQRSTDSLTWTNVDSATSLTYSPTISSGIYYRALVTCTLSGLSDSTNVRHFFFTGPTPVPATLPYVQSFENWIAGCATYDRPDSSWLADPSTGNNSWRRDDQGSDASWTVAGSYMYSPASTDGSHSARFHSGYTHVGINGSMYLYVDMSAPGTKSITFDYINEAGPDQLYVEISTNNGATFTTLGDYVEADSWTNESINIDTTASLAIIRFRAVADYESTDIGIDNLHISVLTPCAGTPAPGAVSATMTASCSAYTSTLSVSPDPSISGITYQWQSSSDSATWANIDSATSTTYVASVTATEYYRLIATCTASGSMDTTAGVALTLTAPTATYATLPFFEGFENWIAGCYSYDRPGVNWINNPSTGNNSWRRDDQGDDASWDGSDGGMYDPASTEGSHSARFHTYEASPFDGTGVGSLDLYVDLSTPGTKTIKFDYNNSNDDEGTDTLQVLISTDSGATFSLLGAYGSTSPDWLSESLTTTVVSPTAIIRFNALSDYGGTDIGIDSLSITGASACDTAIAFTATDITGTSATLSWDAIAGSSYQYVVDMSSGAPATAGTATTATSVAVSGLTAATTYYAHLRTMCADGDSSIWNTISFTTLSATSPCGAVTGLSVTGITSSSATFSWSGTATASGYEYVVDNSESAPAGAGTATTATTVTDTTLACATNYYIHVRTDCSADTSGWVNQPFTTAPCLGVVNVNNENFSLDAYPNPARDIVTLQVNGTPTGKATVRLTDVTGKTIQMVNVISAKTELNMNLVAPGTYFINYVDEVHNNSIKITKQ